MSTLKKKNQNHIFTITTELDPPKSASSAITEEQAQKVAPYVDAVNIADCPMAKMRMSPIALSCIIQQKYQVESIFHLTCRDRNVIGLQAELLGAAALGVHNILTKAFGSSNPSTVVRACIEGLVSQKNKKDCAILRGMNA